MKRIGNRLIGKNFSKWLLLLLLISFCISNTANAQVDIKIISPKPESVVPNQNLFISVEVDSNLHFASANSVEFYMDNYLLSGITKVSGNKVRFVYPYKIKNGKHTLKIDAKFKEIKGTRHGTWIFYAGKKDNADTTGNAGEKDFRKFNLNGMVVLDNRNESLSGSGQALRQEPAFTRSVNVDAVASWENVEIPVKVFATSNNYPGIQSMNYYQTGFRNKWVEVTAGDFNPAFDRLAVNGIRVQGMGIKLKSRLSTLQVFYGNMATPVNGSLQIYTPGAGILPSNLINDSQYVAPGVYRRTVMAARIEGNSLKDDIKLCAGVFKAKDDISSVKYGLSPKDNVVGNIDVVVKLFRKKVVIRSGLAMSILTNDITNGAISKQSLDTAYKVNASFDPERYKDVIILNASTLPANPSAFADIMANYNELNYTNKYQSLTIEYRNIGPMFYSLGNPFLRNDYQGVIVRDRFSMFKKKVSFGVGYQNYSNDLNGMKYMKVYTQGYNGNVFINPGKAWPSLMCYYYRINRNGTSDIANMPELNSDLSNYMININLSRKFLKLTHRFRLVMNVNTNDDRINTSNKYVFYNGMFGVSEIIAERLNINADIGRSVITNAANTSISENNIYSLGLDWQVKPGKYSTACNISNNRTVFTPYTNQSYRLSAMLRFGYRFLKGMEVSIEGGYQPYVDRTDNLNSYSEAYGYLRYSCDLGNVFGR